MHQYYCPKFNDSSSAKKCICDDRIYTAGRDTICDRCSPREGCNNCKNQTPEYNELSETTQKVLAYHKAYKESYKPDLYYKLERVLNDAYKQASEGKGKERHADSEPFEQQQIVKMAKWLQGNPAAGVLFQAAKKLFESTRLTPEAAIQELYGTIVYACAAILIFEGVSNDERET